MSESSIVRALRYGEQLCREAERFQRRVGGAQYLANEGREIPDHLAEAISEGYRELSSDIYYFRKHAAQVDPEAQAAEIARLSAALSEALAQLEAERARNAATVRIHHVQIKTRKVIDRTIPREKQGWWADVCPGRRLVLRDATASDLARCFRNKGASQDPADYFCELPADGSLVSRIAIESMHTDVLPAPPLAIFPGAKP